MGRRLNIGAGPTRLAGYEPWDIKDGRVACPLDVPDGSLEEIYASHVLEHVSHRLTLTVLRDWFRALQPGGRLRVAVPDFDQCVRLYLAKDQAAPIESYIMGGQNDQHDVHRAAFNEVKLTHALQTAGFVQVERWKSEIQDCAALPISLNLQAFKPGLRPSSGSQPSHSSQSRQSESETPKSKIVAVWSTPRLGFMETFDCIYQALPPLGIPVLRAMGAFWGQGIEKLIELAITKSQAEAVLCLDYDSVFTPEDLVELIRIFNSHPEAAALAPMQEHRYLDKCLFNGAPGREQGGLNPIAGHELLAAGDLYPVTAAHFGLTLLRSSAIADLPHPWFLGVPNDAGRWETGKVDDDTHFWNLLNAHGRQAYVAPRVVIGHIEAAVRWPAADLIGIWQHIWDWRERGRPPDSFAPPAKTKE